MLHCIVLLSPQMLAGLGLTKAEGEAALAYFVHPAVADPLVTRASIAVKMSAAPTVYSPDKALCILASVSSPESMSAVQAVRAAHRASNLAPNHTLLAPHPCTEVGEARCQLDGPVAQPTGGGVTARSPVRDTLRAARRVRVLGMLIATPLAPTPTGHKPSGTSVCTTSTAATSSRP